MVAWLVLSERGVDYEFRVSARNSVDFGEPATEIYRTPDGRQYSNNILWAVTITIV